MRKTEQKRNGKPKQRVTATLYLGEALPRLRSKTVREIITPEGDHLDGPVHTFQKEDVDYALGNGYILRIKGAAVHRAEVLRKT
ncbi:MAG: hypothetical protein JRI34_00855 [Deltaproteobacteria bacterium]|nr:hypothetical protein [Deltaproteobacteria bacterium]